MQPHLPLAPRDIEQIIEATRRGSRDSVEHINKAFVKANEYTASALGLPKRTQQTLSDVEYWDKRLSEAQTRVKAMIQRGQKPTRDETLSLLRDCAAVARDLLKEFKTSHHGPSAQLESLMTRIERALKQAEGARARGHPVDLYYTLQAALEANDERRLVALPDPEPRRQYLYASLQAVRQISTALGREIHQETWRRR